MEHSVSNKVYISDDIEIAKENYRKKFQKSLNNDEFSSIGMDKKKGLSSVDWTNESSSPTSRPNSRMSSTHSASNDMLKMKKKPRSGSGARYIDLNEDSVDMDALAKSPIRNKPQIKSYSDFDVIQKDNSLTTTKGFRSGHVQYDELQALQTQKATLMRAAKYRKMQACYDYPTDRKSVV